MKGLSKADNRGEPTTPFSRWNHPMYDSYVVLFVGLALWRSNAGYSVLAVESFLLVNLIEALVENRPFNLGAWKGRRSKEIASGRRGG